MPVTYDKAFFDEHQAGAHRSASAVLPLVFDLVPARSILDVGCGTGSWLAHADSLGVADVQGIDGEYVDRARLEIQSERFHAHDLSTPLNLGRKFDLVMSLEVAEHLDAAAAETFVDSLVRHGDVILFSAAIPKQGGRHHVNEQWPTYWAERFAARGFVCIDALRRVIWNDQHVEWWYAQNTLLYVRETAVARYPKLADLDRACFGPPLSLVHPRNYMWKAKNFVFEG